jgi:amidohydrolase
MNLSPEVLRHRKDLVAIRRAIHQYPEPGFREHRTASLVRAELRRCGIEPRRVCGTGTVGVVRGGRPGPTILIRADMDGLPVTEENRVPYASKTRGMMHACGHDGHVAMALVAARILQGRRASLRGNVKFMFQPAEEGPGGAGPMIEEGLLEKPRVDAAFAIHLWNNLPVGRAGVRAGPVFASADEFAMTVVGKGGHGAAPHQTVDPVAIAAQVVVACQAIVSRRVDPTRASVVTFGEIHGGTRHNIIPDQVQLTGTLRAFDRAVRRQLRADLPRIAARVAAAFGARLRFEFTQGYPPTVNDPKMTSLVRDAAREALGKSAPTEQDPSMGAEDMSLVLERVPGCYLFVGSSNARKGLTFPHHSARFDFDEGALAGGVELWLRLAGRVLNGSAKL